MKEQIKLSEIVGYLPYGLKWTLQGIKTFEMQGITPTTLFTKEGTVLNWEKHPDLPQSLFPLLRTLSDLTKENWSLYNSLYGLSKSEILETPIDNLPHGLIKSWYESEIDIHNLINRGLAIDLNTTK